MRLFTYAIIFYMLAALLWWTFLLYSQNEKIHELKTELIAHNTNFNVLEIEKAYTKSKNMIIGEGIIFMLALVCGVLYLRKMYLQQLRDAVQNKNFLLSVTHELKSPLASIKLALETIFKRDLNHQRNQFIASAALSETNRLEKVIETILESTRLDYIQYRIDWKLVNIIQLQKTISKMHNNLEERLDFEIIGDNNRDFFVDHDGLITILNNLIENAGKYSSSTIYVQIALKTSELHIQVKDEGSGIPKEEKAHVFDRFYRIGNEEVRIAKGTGLGLHIVKRVIEANKGHIQIIDNDPKGTIFDFKIPIKLPA